MVIGFPYPQKVKQGTYEYIQVKAECPVPNVPQVKPHAAGHVGHGGRLTPVAKHLGDPGNAGLDGQPPHVARNEAGICFRMEEHMGTGTDNGHVTFQDIDELGEFVQQGLPEKPARYGDAPVIVRSLQGVRPVIHYHGTELQADECPVVQPATALPEQYRSPGA